MAERKVTLKKPLEGLNGEKILELVFPDPETANLDDLCVMDEEEGQLAATRLLIGRLAKIPAHVAGKLSVADYKEVKKALADFI